MAAKIAATWACGRSVRMCRPRAQLLAPPRPIIFGLTQATPGRRYCSRSRHCRVRLCNRPRNSRVAPQRRDRDEIVLGGCDESVFREKIKGPWPPRVQSNAITSDPQERPERGTVIGISVRLEEDDRGPFRQRPPGALKNRELAAL